MRAFFKSASTKKYNMSQSKIKIKIGAIEIECEGSESFLKKELPEIIKAVSELDNQSNFQLPPSDKDSNGIQNTPESSNSGKIVGTTSTIAGKLSVKSGGDLIIAAAARLTFVMGKEKFSRKDILKEIQSASAYYKSSHSANLSTYLSNLVKDGALLETSSGIYAISAAKLTNLKSRLD